MIGPWRFPRHGPFFLTPWRAGVDASRWIADQLGDHGVAMRDHTTVAVTLVLLGATPEAAAHRDGDAHPMMFGGGYPGGFHGLGVGPMHGTWPQFQRDRDLTAEEVRTIWSGRLLQRGDDAYQVGDITKTDNGNFLVEIVDAKSGAVMHEFIAGARTGLPHWYGQPDLPWHDRYRGPGAENGPGAVNPND